MPDLPDDQTKEAREHLGRLRYQHVENVTQAIAALRGHTVFASGTHNLFTDAEERGAADQVFGRICASAHIRAALYMVGYLQETALGRPPKGITGNEIIQTIINELGEAGIDMKEVNVSLDISGPANRETATQFLNGFWPAFQKASGIEVEYISAFGLQSSRLESQHHLAEVIEEQLENRIVSLDGRIVPNNVLGVAAKDVDIVTQAMRVNREAHDGIMQDTQGTPGTYAAAVHRALQLSPEELDQLHMRGVSDTQINEMQALPNLGQQVLRLQELFEGPSGGNRGR